VRYYHERLRVPLAWWLISGLCVVILGTELLGSILDAKLFGSFGATLGVAAYIVLALICGLTLLHWGGAAVSVTDGELRAARARLPLAAAGEVRPLDARQTRAMRGPRADPSAYLLVRPYLKQSVYVEVSGADAGWPYLLIGTRQPARLAEAIERSRAAMTASDQR
jgi:hypothetical protein